MSSPSTRRSTRKLFAPSAPAASTAVKEEAGAAAASITPLKRQTRSSTTVTPKTEEHTPSTSAVKVSGASSSKSSMTPSKRPSGADFHNSDSPRKPGKSIKLSLEEHEVKAAPKRWVRQLEVLEKQRRRITAPVDTMGCEENGRDERRADKERPKEEEEEERKRERLAVLVGLMLSSQTKDPVTAAAVRNLQTGLPNGLTLKSLLEVDAATLNALISKVGFHNRKTGYLLSMARILQSDFAGDIPRTIDDLCSLPGVGPKMGFLAMQGAWGENVGIGVDVHVHRISNRLGWAKTNDPEGTRLRLQSFLPKEYHSTINKTLVGFGQIICVPIGPRCDLCDLGAQRLCPSYSAVDAKRAAARVKVEMAPKEEEDAEDDKKAGSSAKKEEAVEETANEQEARAEIGGIEKEELKEVERIVKNEASLDW